MISAFGLLEKLRPLHVCISNTGHIQQTGQSFSKLGFGDITGQRFLEVFQVLRPSAPADMSELMALSDRVLRLRFRSEPDILLRGLMVDDQNGGAIIDLSFGIAVVDAVQRFELTAQDFAVSDLAVELLFLQEAKSSAMAASFNLNTRLNGARLAAETEALTDSLTGLHNRRALDGVMERLGQSDTEYSVLHIDLDKFKQVNDTLGHSIGDAVLKRVACIMRRCTRQNDLLVRAGGDEFVVICPGLTDAQRLNELSLSIIKDVSEPVELEGNNVKVGASIGIGICAAKENLATTLVVERADIALYAAKRTGRGCLVFWSPDLGDNLSDLDIPHISLPR